MTISNFSKFKTPFNRETIKKSFKKFKEEYPNNDAFYFDCEEAIDIFVYDGIEKETDEGRSYNGAWRCFDRNDPRGIPYFIADHFEIQTSETQREALSPEDLDIVERFLDTPLGKEEEAWDWFEPWAIKRGWMNPPAYGDQLYEEQVGLKK